MIWLLLLPLALGLAFLASLLLMAWVAGVVLYLIGGACVAVTRALFKVRLERPK